MKALAIHAGPRALAHVRERGLHAGDVRVIPAAAGGPKGLVLSALDQFIFGDWLVSTDCDRRRLTTPSPTPTA